MCGERERQKIQKMRSTKMPSNTQMNWKTQQFFNNAAYAAKKLVHEKGARECLRPTSTSYLAQGYVQPILYSSPTTDSIDSDIKVAQSILHKRDYKVGSLSSKQLQIITKEW